MILNKAVDKMRVSVDKWSERGINWGLIEDKQHRNME